MKVDKPYVQPLRSLGFLLLTPTAFLPSATTQRGFSYLRFSVALTILITAADNFSMQAAGRLAVLSAHLGVAAAEDAQWGIEQQHTRAETEQRPVPAGGKGTLSVIDNRTGKKYTVRAGART